jgi:hypothetical protein
MREKALSLPRCKSIVSALLQGQLDDSHDDTEELDVDFDFDFDQGTRAHARPGRMHGRLKRNAPDLPVLAAG